MINLENTIKKFCEIPKYIKKYYSDIIFSVYYDINGKIIGYYLNKNINLEKENFYFLTNFNFDKNLNSNLINNILNQMQGQ